MQFLLYEAIFKSSKEKNSNVSFSNSKSKLLEILSNKDDNTQ
jgi:hypothetical protein